MPGSGTFELHPGTHVTITGDLEVIDANKAYTHNIRISGYGPMDAEDWMEVYITVDGNQQLWNWYKLYDICIDNAITVPDGITSIADDMFKRTFDNTPFWDVKFSDGRYALCNSISSLPNNTNKKSADVLHGYFGYPISTNDMLQFNYVKTINIGKDVVKIGDRAFKVSHYEDADVNDVNVVSNYATDNYEEVTDTAALNILNTLRQTYDSYEGSHTDYTVSFVNDYQRQINLGNNKFLITKLEPLLESINFADASKIEYIGDYAFGGQTRLMQLDFDEHTPVHIGYGAFKGCMYLDNFNFDENIDISPYMFEGCHRLKSFNKHNSIKSIGIDELNNTCEAFRGCCSLDNLTFHPECDFGKVINYIIGHVHPLWCTNPSLPYNETDDGEGKIDKYERQITYIHGCNTGAVAHAWMGNDNRIIKYDEQYPGGVPMLVFVHGGRADIIKLSPTIWDLTDQGYKTYWEDTEAKVYPVKITGRIWWLNCNGSPGNSALLSVPRHQGSEFFKNNFYPGNHMQNYFDDD